MTPSDQIRAQADDIASRAQDLENLLELMREIIDRSAGSADQMRYSLNTIDTLVTCCQRNVALIHEMQTHVAEALCSEQDGATSGILADDPAERLLAAFRGIEQADRDFILRLAMATYFQAQREAGGRA